MEFKRPSDLKVPRSVTNIQANLEALNKKNLVEEFIGTLVKQDVSIINDLIIEYTHKSIASYASSIRRHSSSVGVRLTSIGIYIIRFMKKHKISVIEADHSKPAKPKTNPNNYHDMETVRQFKYFDYLNVWGGPSRVIGMYDLQEEVNMAAKLNINVRQLICRLTPDEQLFMARMFLTKSKRMRFTYLNDYVREDTLRPLLDSVFTKVREGIHIIVGFHLGESNSIQGYQFHMGGLVHHEVRAEDATSESIRLITESSETLSTLHGYAKTIHQQLTSMPVTMN